MGKETLLILEAGAYASASGRRVEIGDSTRASVEGTRLVRPEEWPALRDRARATRADAAHARIEVTGETTLAAARRLIVGEGRGDVAILNFASAKHPGGGFLSGARAQEESLARASALYATLKAGQVYYDANRASGTLLYTDHAIFSPHVPIFRDDEGDLLDEPYHASFITMPAANAGAMKPGSAEIGRVSQVMEHRIRCVFALAASNACRDLILGAWGCGVFRNDPAMIARLFAAALSGESSWRPYFERIVFAVFDPMPDEPNRSAFERHLGKK